MNAVMYEYIISTFAFGGEGDKIRYKLQGRGYPDIKLHIAQGGVLMFEGRIDDQH